MSGPYSVELTLTVTFDVDDPIYADAAADDAVASIENSPYRVMRAHREELTIADENGREVQS